MSKWVELRDDIVDSLKFDEVTEDMKKAFVKWLLETALPIAKASADKFTSQIKEQAAAEQGWCKIRDLIVLPFVIDGGLWLIKTTLTKTAEKTT